MVQRKPFARGASRKSVGQQNGLLAAQKPNPNRATHVGEITLFLDVNFFHQPAPSGLFYAQRNPLMISTHRPPPQVISANQRIAAANLQRHAHEQEQEQEQEQDEATTRRGYFLFDLAMLRTGEKLLTQAEKSTPTWESTQTSNFLCSAVQNLERETLQSLNRRLKTIGGLAPASSTDQGRAA